MTDWWLLLGAMSPSASEDKKAVARAKPKVEIKLDGEQNEAFVPAYTTFDEITGHILITCQADLAFDDVYITFEGHCKTYVEKIATASPTNNKSEGFSYFLRMTQPMDPDAFPESRLLEAYKPYQFPFKFVVPDRLLPTGCVHEKEPNLPSDAHLKPPPSMGDPMVAAWSKTLMDDMCPDMATITYQLKCRMTKGQTPEGRHRIIADRFKKLCICPASEEAPPLKVDGGDKDDYILRKEKGVQLGTFRRKIGRLSAEAAQPRSLRLPSIRAVNPCPVTTKPTVNLRFDPADEKAEPPRLTAVNAKLKVATFYASRPISQPVSRSIDFLYHNFRGLYVDTLPLVSRDVTNVQWVRQMAEANPSPSGTDSVDRHSKIPAPSKAYEAGHFHTASIDVPIELPKGNKVFVPTFNSCLVSRLYVLDIQVLFEQAKATLKDPSLLLKVPLQISCDSNPNSDRRLSQEDANAEDFFTPRTIAPPSVDFLGRSNISSNPTSPTIDTAPSAPLTPLNGCPATANGMSAINIPYRHISYTEGAAASGSGIFHRSSWAPGVIPQRPTQNVRLMSAEDRSLSLAFDDADSDAMLRAQQAQEEQPPEYSMVGGRWRERLSNRGGRHIN